MCQRETGVDMGLYEEVILERRPECEDNGRTEHGKQHSRQREQQGQRAKTLRQGQA